MQIEDFSPNFDVINEIGKGGFGTVYKVMKKRTNTVLALKRYQRSDLVHEPRLAKSIEAEIKTMQKVDNPHVLKIYEYIVSPHYIDLILDFCDEGDLSVIMVKKNRVFSEQELKPVFFDLLKGFQALRSEGIIHRDIKPANLLMKSGKVVIGDFGVCRYGVIRAETVVGTDSTKAPEIRQVESRERDSYDFKVDVWSLGVTLYMLLVGRDPWNFCDAFTNQPLLNVQKLDFRNFSGKNLPIPPDLPLSRNLERILRWMISLDPVQRPDWTQLQQDSYFDSFRNGQMNANVYLNPRFISVPLRSDHQLLPGLPLHQGPNPNPQIRNPDVGGNNFNPVLNHFGGGNRPEPVQEQNIFAEELIDGLADPPAEVTKDTAFEYFQHNKEVASYLTKTADLLEQAQAIRDNKTRQLLLGCSACALLIAVGVLNNSLHLLQTQTQPAGIETRFGGAGQFYDSVLSQGVKDALNHDRDMIVAKAFHIQQLMEQIPVEDLQAKNTILAHINNCSNDQESAVLSTCKRVAHVLSQEIKKYQQDQTQYPEMKALLVRIYLCLTYQQAMEFRAPFQSLAFNWNNFYECLNGGRLTDYYWIRTEQYLSSRD